MENLISEIRELRLVVDDIYSIIMELRERNLKETLTIQETMKLLKVSKSTIERYISNGILEVVRVGDGKRRLITMSSIKSKTNDGII